MEDKIFGYTREELVKMFEPYSEFEEMVNEETSKYGFATMASDADYKKNYCLLLQQRIMDSKMSKRDKEKVCAMISSLINLVWQSGRFYDVKLTGGLKEFALDVATERIEKHLNQKR